MSNFFSMSAINGKIREQKEFSVMFENSGHLQCPFPILVNSRQKHIFLAYL